MTENRGYRTTSSDDYMHSINKQNNIIYSIFERFGPLTIEWPHSGRNPHAPPKGYAFIVFNNAESVNALLFYSNHNKGKISFPLNCASGVLNKDIQIRPWLNKDRVYYSEGYRFDNVNTRYSIFVGGVSRTTTSESLAKLLQNSIGDVAMVEIEVDEETEYPRGTARVIFSEREAYVIAIASRHLLDASDQQKEMEMRPYLYNLIKCDECFTSTNRFCGELRCLKYLCAACWARIHSKPYNCQHRPMQMGSSLSVHRSLKPYTTISTRISSLEQNRKTPNPSFTFVQSQAHCNYQSSVEKKSLIENIGFWNVVDERNFNSGQTCRAHNAAAQMHNYQNRDGNSFIFEDKTPETQVADRRFGFDHFQRIAENNNPDRRTPEMSNIFNEVWNTGSLPSSFGGSQRNCFNSGFSLGNDNGGISEIEDAERADSERKLVEPPTYKQWF